MRIGYIVAKGLRKVFGKPAINNSKRGTHSKVDVFSTLVESTLGDYSYIGANSTVLYTKIGKFSSISNYCAIGGGGHPTDWVSTSPVFNSSKSILNYHMAENSYNPFTETTIGNDVWIGSHCLIKAGVNIGDGAVVGMGSVVLKDIGPYEIWAGNPAKLIRKRFNEDQTNIIKNIKWWDWDVNILEKHAYLFNNVELLVKQLEAEGKLNRKDLDK